MKIQNFFQRYFLFFISLLVFFSYIPLKVNAQGQNCYGWFCVHAKDHKRPEIDPRLAFVEELGGLYIDRSVSESSSEKVVYLTFDAGYENGNIAKILDILKEENVTGTFFILQNLIQKNPELVKRMVAEGHLVGNHTAHHKDMSKADEQQLKAEIAELETDYFHLIGEKMPTFYRPPEGRFSKSNLEFLNQNGYQTVFWSFAYPDWDNQRQMEPKKAKQIILDNLHNGEIMLLHPTSTTNATILKDVIREIKAQGYQFARIDKLPFSESAKNNSI